MSESQVTDTSPIAASGTGEPADPAAAAAPQAATGPVRPLELLGHVEMAVTVELGRTRMLMRDLLAMRPGRVIELDRSVGSPVDIFVNNALLGRGEVVVVDEELGVRITEIAADDHADLGG